MLLRVIACNFDTEEELLLLFCIMLNATLNNSTNGKCIENENYTIIAYNHMTLNRKKNENIDFTALSVL